MWTVEMTGVHLGTYLGGVPWSGFKMPVSINGGEGGQLVIPVDEFADTMDDLKYLTIPTRRFAVFCWHNEPMAVGLVYGRKYSAASRTLTLTLRDLWSVFEKRTILDRTVAPAKSEVSFGPAAPESLAGRIVDHITARPEYLDDLPIDTPNYVPGTDTVRYLGYNAPNAHKAITDLMGWHDMDIYFRPYWAADGSVRFQMQAGTRVNAGNIFDVNLDGGETGIDFEQDEDATSIVTRAIVFGEGSGKKVVSTEYTKPDEYYLTAEEFYPSKQTNRVGPLLRFGQKMVARFGEPIQQAKLTVQPTSELPITLMVPGSTVRVQAASDGWLDAERDYRIAGYEIAPEAPITFDLQ
jgi:hypothetical protein